MLRYILGFRTCSGLLLALSTLLPAVASAESQCGIVDGHTVKNCQVLRDETTCVEKCEPVNLVQRCSLQCTNSCTETATTECSGSCSTDSLEKCTTEPSTYECTPECTTHCEASCSGHCESSIDKSACSGHCTASCDETCTEKCKEIVGDETCEVKVKTCCEASCTVQENTVCEVSCESECTTELKGACETSCTTEHGALFCEEQYVEGGVDLSNCVDEIESSGTTVEGWLKVDGEIKTTKDGETTTVSCASGSSTPPSGWTGPVTLAALSGALGLLVWRRRTYPN